MAHTSQQDPRRGLPGWALAALFLAAAITPLLAAAATGLPPASSAREFATGLGLTAAALLFLQFPSSGRFEALSSGIGIDRTMGFHRIAAIALLAVALLHPFAYVAETLITNPAAAWNRFGAMLASPHLRSGVAALALLLAIVSLALVRNRSWMRYEVWRMAHGPVALAAAALTFHHAMTAGFYSRSAPLSWIWLAFAAGAATAILLTYVVRPLRMWREDWRVERVRRLGEGIIEMVLRGPKETRLAFRAGQFIWLTLAPHRPPFHDHPFSIASSPAEFPLLRLVIREAGDCTTSFLAIAPGTRAAIDGPHGSFTLPTRGAPVVMIAGGVGIAPVIGILEDAADRGDRRPFRLLYAARCPEALACLDRLEALKGKLELTTTCVVDVPQGSSHAVGRLSRAHIDTLLEHAEPSKAVALVCGPGPMMELASDHLLDAGLSPHAIRFERFDFGAGKGRIDRLHRSEAILVLSLVVGAVAAFALR